MYIEEIRNTEKSEELLVKNGLRPLGKVDYTAGVFDGNKLVATASLKGDIIMGVAVSDEYKGDGLAGQIISHMLTVALQKGKTNVYLFTKPEKKIMFTSLGFKEVATAKPYACMLEFGNGLRSGLSKLTREAFDGFPEAAALVMNCNPFTNGHLYLVETAAKENEFVYLFVVQEDISEFPFKARLELVRKSTAHLPNVKVIPGGKYIISSLTFPSYFSKEEDVAKAHSSLDLVTFCNHIAPAMNIKRRYVGTEPLSPVTNCYNECMQEILPARGIEVRLIERVSDAGCSAAPISASRVRKLILDNDTEAIQRIVPPATYEYIVSNLDYLQNRISSRA